MSEIRFVERLGDAIEAAAAQHIASRRRRLRRLLGGVVGVAIIGTSVATATTLIGHPEELASGAVACYSTTSLDGGANVIPPDDRTPVAACAAELGQPGPHVACDAGDTVAVFPAAGTAICERHGYAPLPASYAGARDRVAALAADIRALERGCVPPQALARRVQALLDRSRWSGWRTWLRLDVSDGPCGSVSLPNGDRSRSVEPALDFAGRRVMVFAEPRR